MKINIFLVTLILIILFVFFVNIEYFTENKLNIIQLILYSDSDEYYQMYQYTNEYYRKFNNIKTFYYKFSSDVKKITIDGDFILIPGNETYIPGILDKTIKVIEYINEHMNYDYIVRSNISSIINFDLLTEYLTQNPLEFGGTFIFNLDRIDPRAGLVDSTYLNTTLVTGTNIIFSNKMIKEILSKKQYFHYDLVDDVSISVLVKEEFPNIIPTLINKYLDTSNDNNIISNINDVILYRNNTSSNRLQDIINIKNVINKLETHFIFPYQKINQIYYINANQNIHKRNDMIDNFNKYGIPKNIITIIHTENNYNGHIEALEQFIKSDHNICIILDDDFEFTDNKYEFIKKLNEVLNKDFDIYNLNVKIDNKLPSNYMITKKFSQQLLNNYKSLIS